MLCRRAQVSWASAHGSRSWHAQHRATSSTVRQEQTHKCKSRAGCWSGHSNSACTANAQSGGGQGRAASSTLAPANTSGRRLSSSALTSSKLTTTSTLVCASTQSSVCAHARDLFSISPAHGPSRIAATNDAYLWHAVRTEVLQMAPQAMHASKWRQVSVGNVVEYLHAAISNCFI